MAFEPCKKCGASLPPSVSFCLKCGRARPGTTKAALPDPGPRQRNALSLVVLVGLTVAWVAGVLLLFSSSRRPPLRETTPRDSLVRLVHPLGSAWVPASAAPPSSGLSAEQLLRKTQEEARQSADEKRRISWAEKSSIVNELKTQRHASCVEKANQRYEQAYAVRPEWFALSWALDAQNAEERYFANRLDCLANNQKPECNPNPPPLDPSAECAQ